MDYQNMRDAILDSSAITELTTEDKPPVPRCAPGQKYVFISYSHKDYKAVYSDLLELHRAGVRYWYDSGLPAGKDWDSVVEEKIKSAACAGVIFYLSENLFLSKSVIKEVDFTMDNTHGSKEYFCINLSGMQPSKILNKIIRSHDDDELEHIGLIDRVPDLLSAFSDKATYISKAADSDRRHIQETLHHIEEQFPLAVGDGKSNAAQAGGAYTGYPMGFATESFIILNGVLSRYLGNDKVVNVPDGVKVIGKEAFKNCHTPVRIRLCEGVESIEESAFEGCYNLVEINLPDSIKSIGYNAFKDCSSLVLTTVPRHLDEIGWETFSGCTSIEEMDLPDGLTEINFDAFEDCTSLLRISIPVSCDVITYSAFEGCHRLTLIEYGGTRSMFKKLIKKWRIIIPEDCIIGCEDGSFVYKKSKFKEFFRKIFKR